MGGGILIGFACPSTRIGGTFSAASGSERPAYSRYGTLRTSQGRALGIRLTEGGQVAVREAPGTRQVRPRTALRSGRGMPPDATWYPWSGCHPLNSRGRVVPYHYLDSVIDTSTGGPSETICTSEPTALN